MYGIKTPTGLGYLYYLGNGEYRVYHSEYIDVYNMVLNESASEIDMMLQEMIVLVGRYDLVVFKLSEDQIERQLIQRLKH